MSREIKEENGKIVVGKTEEQKCCEKADQLEEEIDFEQMPDWAQMLYQRQKQIVNKLEGE